MKAIVVISYVYCSAYLLIFKKVCNFKLLFIILLYENKTL